MMIRPQRACQAQFREASMEKPFLEIKDQIVDKSTICQTL